MQHGFTLLTEKELHEAGGRARVWRHDATGAQLLSIVNDDENKCFGVTFRTPPKDSTGVAHILEHSVLCGSDRYPVKEPFVELLKGSLQTFLNAFTFPDKTCYPVASANLQDFYNLMDVYIDAVFHPRISEDIFRQEGWHVEAESAEGPWSYKGVVYNEMKGAYSSPDSVLAEQSQQSLFPDTLYSLDSGGNPEHIPDLTYEAFVDFHRSFYHPGNARFFFWGDDTEDERLRRVNEAIKGYGCRQSDSCVPLQPRLDTPRQIEVPYAASKEETRAHMTVNWLLGERADVEQALIMEMLEHILEGMPGSPLRRALIASGLGEDVTGCGLETDLRQMYYSTGLKGMNPDDVPRASLIIFDTLAELAETGFDAMLVEAAVNTVEFAYRENNSGRFPRGLAAMIQALSTWLYDGDPLAALAWEAPLARIKARLASGERVFEDAVRRWMLDNPHRSTVILLPDHDLGRRRDEAEAARLDAVRAAGTPADHARLAGETARLQAAQEAPDSPEALATIPNVGIADLPRHGTELPIAVSEDFTAHSTLLEHDLPTRGVAYTCLQLPLDQVDDDLVPLLPLFGRCLTELGTARRDFTELGARIAAKTGGFGAAPGFGTTRDRQPLRHFIISGKTVYDKLPEYFALLREVLFEPLTDRNRILERLGQMLLEEKSRLEQGLVAAGHATISSRLRAHFTQAGRLMERTGGLSYLQSLRALLRRLKREPDAILADLDRLRRAVIAAPGAVADCTAEASGLALARPLLAGVLDALPASRPPCEHPCGQTPLALPDHEAILTEAQINYVGKAVNLYDLGHTFHGSFNVILRALRMGYLWERVRVRGGAYGAFCNLDRNSGTLIFASYRDPNVSETLDAFDAAADFLRAAAPAGPQLERAIVGGIGDLDAYMLPDAKGATALARWLSGETPEERARVREEMFATTTADFHAFADILRDASAHAGTCVLGGSKARSAAGEHRWSTVELMEEQRRER